MNKLEAEWRKYLLGSAFLLSILIGGSAARGLWTDSIIEVILIASAACVLASPMGEPIDRRVWVLLGLISIAMVVQLIPLPAGLLDKVQSEVFRQGRVDGGSEMDFISLGVGRTVESALYVFTLMMFGSALLRLKGEQLHALLPFLLAGVACHVIAAAVQYSASDTLRTEGLMPYTIRAGLFASRNHFASLMYVSLPFLLYVGTFRGMALWAGIAMILILLVLLAAGSRAGAALGLAAMICAAMLLASRSRAGVGTLVALVTVAGIYSVGTWTLLESRELDPAFGRMEFVRSTAKGIGENWLTGVGYGNFTQAYQAFESPKMIFKKYVNLAHNDYLQLAFEGGIFAAALVVAYLALIVTQLFRVRHSHFQKAAFLGILFILVHSTVDYPLRTMAVVVVFVYLNAILFHTALRPQIGSNRSRARVRHDGREMVIPLEAARR